MLGAFGGGAGLGYPQPVGGQAVCHAQGLHMKRIKGIDLNDGTASNSDLYVFAINKACGSGPFETIGYDPVSGQWTESLEDPVPTAATGPLDGFHMDMINAGGYTFSVANGIRGVLEPLRLDFQIGEFSGGLVLQRTTDLIHGQPLSVLFDELNVPNGGFCEGHPDGVPLGTPYSYDPGTGGTLAPVWGSTLVAWRDGLLIQGGSGYPQVPNITNLALFNIDPGDDVSSMAHHDLAGCSHVHTIQFTPWHPFNDFWDSSGISRLVAEMDPGGRFGTQSPRIIGLGPSQDVVVHADGLIDARGIDVYPPFVPTTSGVAIFFKIESPVRVLVTASDGRRIGADLDTGVPINDFGPAGYDSGTDEPHIYGVRDPLPGTYGVATRGTGTGAYTITSYGIDLESDDVSQVQMSGGAAPVSSSSHSFGLDGEGSLSPDSDGDTIPDAADNCSAVKNADQRDADGDGYGSLCDADFDNSCIVNFADLAIMRAAFFTSDPNANMDGLSAVDFADLALLRSRFFRPPGPSGVASLCGSTLRQKE